MSWSLMYNPKAGLIGADTKHRFTDINSNGKKQGNISYHNINEFLASIITDRR